ncbi:MAG TPA: EndoU domain-containing protein [Thermoanaerobaculia bacterium]|nr:EndoU domain-containing protein [Thermoanaerobaculia bacterium]
MKRTLLSLAGLLLGLAIYYLAPEEGRYREAEAPPRTEAARPLDSEWSDTDPAINLAHIFEGEINRRGKPTGFHSRPGGTDPVGARVARRVSGPNALGVYIAEVEVRNGSGRWLRKTSTFYPDSLSLDEVVAAILHAWEERRDLGGDKFQGPSGKGFTIEGYTLDDGGINTAYPLYKR